MPEEQKYSEEIIKVVKTKKTRKVRQKVNTDDLLLKKILAEYKDPNLDKSIEYVTRRINECKNDPKSQMEYLQQYKRYMLQK